MPMISMSPLQSALAKFGVVCAVECACIKAMGEMYEPWVMRVMLSLV